MALGMDHKRETPDRSKINVGDAQELSNGAGPLAKAQLTQAVETVGTTAATSGRNYRVAGATEVSPSIAEKILGTP